MGPSRATFSSSASFFPSSCPCLWPRCSPPFVELRVGSRGSRTRVGSANYEAIDARNQTPRVLGRVGSCLVSCDGLASVAGEGQGPRSACHESWVSDRRTFRDEVVHRSRGPDRGDPCRDGALRASVPRARVPSRRVPAAARSPARDPPLPRADPSGSGAARRHERASQVLPAARAHHVAAGGATRLLAPAVARPPVAGAAGGLQVQVPGRPRAALRVQHRQALVLSRPHAPARPRRLSHRHTWRWAAQGDHRAVIPAPGRVAVAHGDGLSRRPERRGGAAHQAAGLRARRRLCLPGHPAQELAQRAPDRRLGRGAQLADADLSRPAGPARLARSACPSGTACASEPGVAMLTRIDHVMICPPSLEHGIEAYTRIGFDIRPGGATSTKGTHNAIAFLEDDYLELASMSDREAYLAASPGGGLADFLARGGGFRYVIVQSDDLAADVRAMRQRGVEVGDPTDGSRRTPSGQTLNWKLAVPGPANPLPLLFIQHLTPLAERRAQAPGAGHPNRALRIDRVYIVVSDIAVAVPQYSRVLGMPAPSVQRGAVIKADMAVFDLGPTGLTLARPAEPEIGRAS